MSETKATKAFDGFEIKDADKGEVEAIIATLGVIDRDGDILRKGSIPDGAKVQMSAWGHDAVFGNRPIGKGVISIDGDKAVFKGRVFLNTAEGRETFEVLKEMGRDQEWSWGFRVTGSEVPSEDERKKGAFRILTKTDPFEVSPVIIGAGVGTRTLGVKSADAQADGASDPVDPELEAKAKADAEAKAKADEEMLTKIAAAAVASEIARRDAEAVEQKRIADEMAAKAAADLETARLAAEHAERMRVSDLAAKEFDRLQRNMRKHKIA